MAWGGQWCTSPGYAYVHESVAEAFVVEAKAALIALYGKDPKANPDYSPCRPLSRSDDHLSGELG
jgi:aldehyde dehydrogenase (NAD+)